MTNDNLEDLRQRTDRGSRLDEAANELDHQDLVERLVTELEAMDAGEKQKTVSVWDEHMAAVIRVLETDEDLREDVVSDLSDALDADPDGSDRSTVLRLTLRLGFHTASPDVMDAVEDAARERAVQNL